METRINHRDTESTEEDGEDDHKRPSAAKGESPVLQDGEGSNLDLEPRRGDRCPGTAGPSTPARKKKRAFAQDDTRETGVGLF